MVKNELLQQKAGAKKLTQRNLYGVEGKCADLEGSGASEPLAYLGGWLASVWSGGGHTPSSLAVPSPHTHYLGSKGQMIPKIKLTPNDTLLLRIIKNNIVAEAAGYPLIYCLLLS